MTTLSRQSQLAMPLLMLYNPLPILLNWHKVMNALLQFFASVPVHLQGVILYVLWGSVRALRDRAVVFQQFCLFYVVFPIWTVGVFREVLSQPWMAMVWVFCALAGIAYGWKWGTATPIEADHKAKAIILPRSNGMFGLVVFLCLSIYASRLFKASDAPALFFITRVDVPLALGIILGRGLSLIRKYRKLAPSTSI